MAQVSYIDFLREFSLQGQPGDWVHDPWMDKKLTCLDYRAVGSGWSQRLLFKDSLDTGNLGGRMNDDQMSFVI